MKSAGYNLDDKRDKIDDNDIPNVIAKWKEQATAWVKAYEVSVASVDDF